MCVLNTFSGNFYMVLHGDGVSSVKLRLNPEEAFFEPGRVYHFIAITQELGHVQSSDLIWEYIANPINPLTWRIHSPSKIFVNRFLASQEPTYVRRLHLKKQWQCSKLDNFQ
jgi:hypothetical protein